MQQAGDAISLEMIKEHFSRIKEYFTSDKEKEFWASVKYIFDNFKNNTPEMLEQIRKRLKKKLDDMETEKLIEIAKTLQQERELSERLSSAHIDLQKFDEWFSKRGARLTGLREELIKCDEEIEKYNLKLKNYLPQNVAQTSTQTNQLLDELAIDGCEDEEFQMLIRKRVQDFLKETKSLKDQKIAEIKSSLEEAKRRANDVNEKHDLLLNEQTSKREEKTQMELKIENLKEKIADACAERERYDDELKKNEKEITKSQTICQNYESQQLELEITRLLKDIELLEKELTRQNTAEQDEELSQTGSAVTVRDGE
uniref:Uncharacterized protein n=1 Tax=Acrobeloides nanus TaxID=290746 RepID=A0A914C8R0_9BILA